MNVCYSNKLMSTMAPFCDKFYKRGDVSYKMCQSSFCFDCCSSELKINDQTDSEIRKCISKCLTSLRETVAKNASIAIRTSDLKEGEDPDKEVAKAKDSEGEKKDSDSPSADPKPVAKPVSKKKKRKHHDTCFDDKPNGAIAEDYCKINFDPSAEDERLRDIDKCMKVFCPMCCVKNYEDPQEMMDCQKKCRTTIDSAKNVTAKDPVVTNTPQNLQTDGSKEQILSVAQDIVQQKSQVAMAGTVTSQTQGGFTVPKNTFFDEDELSFLSTICSSFQTSSFSLI